MTNNTSDSGRHPDEHLGAYVEGSLDDGARADVEQHLARCDSCRREVHLAQAARERLRALPQAEVPAATRRAMVRAIEHDDTEGRRPLRPGSTASGSDRRVAAGRWLAGLAAAAVIVGLIAVVLPRLSSNTQSADSAAMRASSEGAGGGAAPAERSGAPIVERQDTDYGPAEVAALADAAAKAATPSAAPEQAEAREPAEAAQAIACVRRWASAAGAATTIRIIEASYQGRPAYLGVARQMPGQGPDRILVWVLAREACELISYTQRRV